MRVNKVIPIAAAWMLSLAMISPVHAEPGERYVLVSHAADSDSWWNTVKNAIRHAGEDYGVQVDYRNPPDGDLSDMARLLEQAAARNYTGVAYDVADIDVLTKPVARINAKGINTVTINAGTPEQSRKLGAIMHIGLGNYEAGKAAGEKAKAAGVSSFLCINHNATNQAQFERCKGFGDALGLKDIRSSVIDTGVDPTVVAAKVGAYLRNNPGTQAILALGPDAAVASAQVVQRMGLSGKIFFATFDLLPGITDAIKKGTINFAIDQQPYLQGYMSIAALVIAHRENTKDPARIIAALKANPKFQARLAAYGLKPVYGERDVAPGPAFVTKENVSFVEKYAGQYR
jgi:simple sugar transport system substrate-binding protein